LYVAQVIPKLDAKIEKNSHFWYGNYLGHMAYNVVMLTESPV
jgi:hypothetical protein